MVVVLKRKIENEMWTTYLPTILLMLTTLSTILYKPEHFEAAVSVNLTSMLVMTTIFTGVSDSLPETAYVKLIDVWLIFGQMIPFLEVILLTVLEALRKEDESRTDQHEEERVVEISKVSVVKVELKYLIKSTLYTVLCRCPQYQSLWPL